MDLVVIPFTILPVYFRFSFLLFYLCISYLPFYHFQTIVAIPFSIFLFKTPCSRVWGVISVIIGDLLVYFGEVAHHFADMKRHEVVYT